MLQKIFRGRFIKPDLPYTCERIRRMSVLTLSDLDAVRKFVKLNTKCCIYYTADWCGPCQAIKPVYKELADTYKGSVALGMVDVDHNPSAAADAKVSSIPTFYLYNNDSVFQTFSGADSNKLKDSLSELVAKQ